MKHRFFVSLLILFAVVTVAKSQKDATAEINKIKVSNKYISVTGSSMNSMEEASEYGKLLLSYEIEKWLKDNVKGDITGYVTKSKENTTAIETRRGRLYRSFIYVKKSDILPYYKDEEVITEIPQSIDTSQCEYIEATPPSASSVTDKPSVDDESQSSARTIAEEEAKMLDVFNTKTFNQYLSELKESGRLASYGMQKAWPKEGKVYVFFIAPDRSVKDHIRLIDGNAVNLSTKTSVDVWSVKKKYDNGSYIWFTLKEK